MITYHALGFYGLFTALAAGLLLRILPRDSAAHRLTARATLVALVLVAALVGLSY